MTETKCFRDAFRERLHELSGQPNILSLYRFTLLLISIAKNLRDTLKNYMDFLSICLLLFHDVQCDRSHLYTVQAKIIEPPHKTNVYEKFYFSRKSISPNNM